MSEITRTIQVQITIVAERDVMELLEMEREGTEKCIRNLFEYADQILVDVKDFIREE